MQNVNIPATDLTVSALGFGNFTFGTNWWGDFSDEDALALQRYAVERGVNFFDTAPAYGNGRAEDLLGKTVAEVGRDKLVISTKFGYDFYKDPGKEGSHRERKQDFSPQAIRFEVEQSLKRMGIDCIDLYQAHNLKLPQMTDAMFETLVALRDEGKIRHFGVALGPAIGWREEGVRALADFNCATVQTVYNLYEQHPGRELCELADSLGRGGVIARVPTNSGILDEEFDSPDHQFPARDHRKFRDRNWLVYGLKKNEMIRPLAEQCECSIRQLAFRWLMSQPAMVSVEPNILSRRDINDFTEAADMGPLPAEVLRQLGELYERDFDLGPDAHACDLKSSIAEGGAERSGYVALV